jgi:uncharacterized membrane protein
MKPFWGNLLRIFGVIIMIIGILLELPKRTPPFDTGFIIIVIVAGFLLIILGTVLLKRKLPEK